MPVRRAALAAVLTVSFLAVPLAARADAAPPAHDDRAGAVLVRSLPYSDVVDTTDATGAADDPVSQCGGGVATVWYTIRLDESQRVKVDTHRSSYGTVISVFTRAGGTFHEVQCRNNAFDPYGWTTFEARAGTRYYLMVSTCCVPDPGAPGWDGILRLDVTAAPPVLHGKVTVDAAWITSDEFVTVAGKTRCTSVAAVAMDVSITQETSHGVASAGASAMVGCAPDGRAWHWELHHWGEPPFEPGGVAHVHIEWFVTDFLTSDRGVVDTDVSVGSGPPP